MSLPTYVTTSGLPLGLLVNSSAHNDGLLLQMGELFEKANRFHILTAVQKGLPTNLSQETQTRTKKTKNQQEIIPVSYHTKSWARYASLQTSHNKLPQTSEDNSQGISVAAYVSLFLGTLFLAGSASKQKETH